MRLFILTTLLFLGACSSRPLNTSQPFHIDVIGTDEAYCIVSTPHYRYAVNAPGGTTIERSGDEMKVDCRDNAIQRRRTVMVQPVWDELYYRYPDTVTVDFSSMDNGSRLNGFRAELAPVAETTAPTSIVQSVPVIVSPQPVLTEDSYSEPVILENDKMVEKTYKMGRRSYPEPLYEDTSSSLQSRYALTPELSSEIVDMNPAESVVVYPIQ